LNTKLFETKSSLQPETVRSICFLFQRNLFGGLAFLGVDEVSVDLGGGDILVRQHFGDGVDVCSHGELEYSVGMSETMKGDMFGSPHSS